MINLVQKNSEKIRSLTKVYSPKLPHKIYVKLPEIKKKNQKSTSKYKNKISLYILFVNSNVLPTKCLFQNIIIIFKCLVLQTEKKII